MVRQVRLGNLVRLEAQGWAKGSEGIQNRPPPDVPLGHEDYSKLKAIETLQTHEKLLPLP